MVVEFSSFFGGVEDLRLGIYRLCYLTLRMVVKDEVSVTKLQFSIVVAELCTTYMKMHQIDF